LSTSDSSAFKDRRRKDGSGKSDVLFNGPDDGAAHGHVVQSFDADGTPVYHYVRDVEGNVYIDDSQGSTPQPPAAAATGEAARRACGMPSHPQL
jgi:hypothetical protein